MANQRKIDIVTVVFHDEISLLTLQARSLREFFPHDMINRIYVIFNQWNSDLKIVEHMKKTFNEYIAKEYGGLSSKICLLDNQQFFSSSVTSTFGWRNQQVLKLLVSKIINSDHYIVLDAKNIFVREVRDEYFFSKDKMISFAHSHYHHHEPNYRATYEYFGLDADKTIDNSFTTITPALMKTSVVRDLIDYVERRELRPLDEVFLRADCQFLEFYLYSAYINFRFGSEEALYVFDGKPVYAIFPNELEDPERLVSRIENVIPSGQYMIGIHRDTVKALPNSVRVFIAQYIERIGIASYDEVLLVLSRVNNYEAFKLTPSQDGGTLQPSAPVPENPQRAEDWELATLTLSMVNALKQGHVKFIQIGGNDGQLADPVSTIAKQENWHGVILEPVPAYYKMLSATYNNHPNVECINAAIDAQNGTRNIYVVKEQAIRRQIQEQNVKWIQGLASFYPEHLERHGIKPHDYEAIEIQTVTGATLTAEKMCDCDVLIIDVEGAEHIVLSSFDFTSWRPACILFETMHITAADRQRFEALLGPYGYKFRWSYPDSLAYQSSI